MDRTLILVKPDAFARRLTGEIIARFERKGLHLAELKRLMLDEATARRHYEEHTSELQSHSHLVCRLLLEKKKKDNRPPSRIGQVASASRVPSWIKCG